MVARLLQPFDSWDSGLVALCDALADSDREKVVVSRLEATARVLPMTSDDIIALALTVRCRARFEFHEPRSRPIDPKIAEIARALDRGGISEVFQQMQDAQDRIDDFVF